MKNWNWKYILISSSILLALGIYPVWLKHKAVIKLPEIDRRSGEALVSSEIMNVQRAVEYYRYEIRRDPEAVDNYVQLAQLYLHQARLTRRHGDYIPQAQRMLAEGLKREPENIGAMITQASLLLTLHRFEEARSLAEKVIAKYNFKAPAWGVLSDALKELGDYAGAVQACDRMLSLRPDLRSYARASHLREIHGDLRAAIQAMKLASGAGVIGLENRAWSLYQMGNLYFKASKLDTAEYIYRGILEERPDYPFALRGLAKIQGARANYDEAIRLLSQAYQLAPEHEFLEELVALYRITGQPQKAEDTVAKVFAAMRQDEQLGWNINREYAEFCLRQNLRLTEALQRAETEYLRRPHNIEVQLTYAWALYKNGQATKAASIIERAMRLDTPEARLFYRAGMIARQRGRYDHALNYLQRALRIRVDLSVHELNQAEKGVAELHSFSYKQGA